MAGFTTWFAKSFLLLWGKLFYWGIVYPVSIDYAVRGLIMCLLRGMVCFTA